MALENVTETFPVEERRPAPAPGDPLAIQVESLHKAFRIPTQRVDSFKERAVRPLRSRDYRELLALNGISFEVRKGEFFGIVGRNGSGKSTLLKLLASIYRADAGTIRMAGRLAPFIELGVGFNVELTARQNAVLNGVMMGLTPRESRNRLDAVIEFAELEEFVDLKLKNYSSGMLVRLAFSLMLEVDADILLIDEVLAVGDAAFQQKCADAFHSMKAAGKTIVLVTHEMSTVEQYCHRAMLIHEGNIEHIGDPGAVGRRYLELNFKRITQASRHPETEGSDAVQLITARLEGSDDEEVKTLEYGEELRFEVDVEALEDFAALDVGFIVANADGVGITAFSAPVGGDLDDERPVTKGERVKVVVKMENRLAPGHYFVHCGINHASEGRVALYVHNAIEFVVYGTGHMGGVIAINHSVESVIEAPR
ncbi:MAG TPA: ABC transporter ATP-binding protein [Solirubrobacterales bacterium]|jgi:ABC-type polysaccharide/polyol phosphate transport system ATPase subunit